MDDTSYATTRESSPQSSAYYDRDESVEDPNTAMILRPRDQRPPPSTAPPPPLYTYKWDGPIEYSNHGCVIPPGSESYPSVPATANTGMPASMHAGPAQGPPMSMPGTNGSLPPGLPPMAPRFQPPPPGFSPARSVAPSEADSGRHSRSSRHGCSDSSRASGGDRESPRHRQYGVKTDKNGKVKGITRTLTRENRGSGDGW